MSFRITSFIAIWLAICSCITVTGQDKPSLDSRIIAALKVMEPEWTSVAVIESARLPVVPSEKRIVARVWQNPKSHSEDVNVYVYGVSKRDDARAWLKTFRNKQVYPGWQVSTYEIGDEGYVANYNDGRRFEIEFRVGVVVGKVAGSDLPLVKDFSKCIVQQIVADAKSR